MADDDVVRAAVRTERRELAAMLGDMSPETWGAATLCDGWRVREVVAHMTMPFRMSAPRFLAAMVRARGNFNRMADRQARRDTAKMSDVELLESLRDNVDHQWKPPGGGIAGALSHDVIHGLDIAVGAGLPRRPPADRVGLVLGTMRESNRNYFGVDLTGVRLVATDLDWEFGDGEPLRGTAADLLLVLCGRRVAEARLDGAQANRYVR